MKGLKELSRRQKLFLEDEGLNSSDFRIIRKTADDYIFYNTRTKKELEMRR